MLITVVCTLGLVGPPLGHATSTGSSRLGSPVLMREEPAAIGRRAALFAAAPLITSLAMPLGASAAVTEVEQERAQAKAERDREAASVAKEKLKQAAVKEQKLAAAAKAAAKERVQALQAVEEHAKIQKAKKAKAQAIKGIRRANPGRFLDNLLVAGVLGVGLLAALDTRKEGSDSKA